MGAGRLIVVGGRCIVPKQVFTAISGKPRAKESNGNVQGGINFFLQFEFGQGPTRKRRFLVTTDMYACQSKKLQLQLVSN